MSNRDGIMTRPQNAERIERAVALYREGLSLQQVGAQLGVSYETVRRYLIGRDEPLRRRGRPLGFTCPRILTKRTQEIAESYLRGGVTLREVGAQFGIAVPTTYWHVAKYRELTGGQA